MQRFQSAGLAGYTLGTQSPACVTLMWAARVIKS